MSPTPEARRRRETVGWATLALCILLAGSSFAIAVKVDQFSRDVRDSALDGCHRQNEVRRSNRIDAHEAILSARDDAKQQIEAQGRVTNADFPSFTPGRFRQLERQARGDIRRHQHRTVADARDKIQRNHSIDCIAKYPS